MRSFLVKIGNDRTPKNTARPHTPDEWDGQWLQLPKIRRLNGAGPKTGKTVKADNPQPGDQLVIWVNQDPRGTGVGGEGLTAIARVGQIRSNGNDLPDVLLADTQLFQKPRITFAGGRLGSIRYFERGAQRIEAFGILAAAHGYRPDRTLEMGESELVDLVSAIHRLADSAVVLHPDMRLTIGIPTSEEIPSSTASSSLTPVPRATRIQERIIRDTDLGQQVKSLHDFRCQVCGIRLECPDGPYAEAAHIMPLGRPHDGPDTPENILCLCPNHHVLFDGGAFSVADDFSLVGAADDLSLVGSVGRLRTTPSHHLDLKYLRYQRNLRQKY